MNRPNLFTFAVSELAQDAFICWLASWANPKYKTSNHSLHVLANQFLQSLIEKHRPFAENIDTLTIIRQKRGLDILIRINEKICLLIEDKVQAKEGETQLHRYLDACRKDYPNDELLGIYLKTGNQGTPLCGPAEFKTYARRDLLSILETGSNIQSDIFQDFLCHLRHIEKQTLSFLETPINQWSKFAWHGFYMHLQENGFDNWQWAYVSNPNGGFTGLWGPRYHNNCYIQLEQQKYDEKINPLNPQGKAHKMGTICFKYNTECREKTALHAKRLADEIKALVNKKVALLGLQASKLRKGQYMTFARSGDYRIANELGIINLTATINRIREHEDVLKNLQPIAS